MIGLGAAAGERRPLRSTSLPAAVVLGSVLPLVRRFQVGEGMLLLINVSLVFASRTSTTASASAGGIVASLVALAVMYGFNDWWDAHRDLANPRKDHELASSFIVRRRSMLAVLLAEHVAALAVALAFVGPRSAAAAAITLALNAVYSMFLKGIPVVDVVVVGLWGGAFAAMIGPAPACVAVGAMTAISHLFQAMGDRDADMRSGVRTSAASSTTSYTVLAVGTVVLVAALWGLVSFPLALVGASPLVFGVLVRRSLKAWLLSKAAFGAVWLLVIHGLARVG